MSLEPANVRRILVRANNWIGDVVMISPAIRALRERFARAEIAIVAKPWVLDALSANRSFDRLIPFEDPGRHAGPLGGLRLALELRRERFDLAVLFQKAFEAALIARLAGIPVRVGVAADRRGWLLTHAVPPTPLRTLRHHVDQFLDVAVAAGCRPESRVPTFAMTAEDLAWSDRFLPAGERWVALHPGGSKAPRAWSTQRYAELARQLDRDEGLRPVVVGGPEDLAAGQVIAAAVPRSLVAAGATTIRQMGALIHRATLFVGNDSGPMHIAGAVGTPGVGVFGPGAPEKTAPVAPTVPFEAVTLRFACSPCRQKFFRECEPSPAGKPYCLESLDVARVMEACRRVLASAPPRV